jgi:hypothetical protein
MKGNEAKKTTAVNNGNCLCPNGNVGNYQKDILKMNYTTYYNSNIFKRECIPLPPSKAHYPPQTVKSNKLCNDPITLEEFINIQANC